MNVPNNLNCLNVPLSASVGVFFYALTGDHSLH